jgi:hypothetical protein
VAICLLASSCSDRGLEQGVPSTILADRTSSSSTTLAPDVASLGYIDWGATGSAGATFGDVEYWPIISLFNVGERPIEILSLDLGAPYVGSGTLLETLTYNDGLYDDDFVSSVGESDLPEYVVPLELPLVLLPIDTQASAGTGRPQDDSNAIRVVLVMRYDSGTKFAAGPMMASYRVEGTTQLATQVQLNSVSGIFCSARGPEGCSYFPAD